MKKSSIDRINYLLNQRKQLASVSGATSVSFIRVRDVLYSTHDKQILDGVVALVSALAADIEKELIELGFEAEA